MSPFRNTLLIIAVSLLISVGGYFLYYRFWLKKGGGAASLNVQSLYENRLNVSVDDKNVGSTPLELSGIAEGEKVMLLSDGRNSYQMKVNLSGGTLTVVNWGLGPTGIFSEGEVLWFEKGQPRGTAPLLVIADPESVEVRLDDVLIGNAPLVNRDLSAGEHTLKISKEGYKERLISINLQEGYKLNVKAKLFPLPTTNQPAVKLDAPGDPRFLLTELSSGSPSLAADPAGWVKGLIFYTKPNYDYFLDFRGQLYDSSGVKVSSASEVENKLEKVKIAYLSREGGGLSEEAKASLTAFAGKVFLTVPRVEVISTPTGWLRIREKPSLSAKEIGRVSVREKLDLLGESGEWYQIKTAEGTVGYIAAAYAKKL